MARMGPLSLAFTETTLAVQFTLVQCAAQAAGRQLDSVFLTHEQFPAQMREAITQQLQSWRILSLVPTQFLTRTAATQEIAPASLLWMRPHIPAPAQFQNRNDSFSLQPTGTPDPVGKAPSQEPPMHPVLAEKIRRWGIPLNTLNGPPPPSDEEQFTTYEKIHPLLQRNIETGGINLNEEDTPILNPADDIHVYLSGERTHPVLARNIFERGIPLPQEVTPISQVIETAQGSMDASWQTKTAERALPLPAYSNDMGEQPLLVTSASIHQINSDMTLQTLLAIFKSGGAVTNGTIILTLTLKRNKTEKPTLLLTISSISKEAILHFSKRTGLPFLGTAAKIGDQFVFTFRRFPFRDGKTFLLTIQEALLSP